MKTTKKRHVLQFWPVFLRKHPRDDSTDGIKNTYQKPLEELPYVLMPTYSSVKNTLYRMRTKHSFSVAIAVCLWPIDGKQHLVYFRNRPIVPRFFLHNVSVWRNFRCTPKPFRSLFSLLGGENRSKSSAIFCIDGTKKHWAKSETLWNFVRKYQSNKAFEMGSILI